MNELRGQNLARMNELRDSIKRWEHSFLESHGHKPSADDIRADAAIRDMYKRYHAAKRAQTEASQGPLTPQKRKPATSVPPPAVAASAGATEAAPDADTDTDADDTVTPQKNKITEIFPTPQFQGRALGLFDLELSPPETPSKRTTDSQDAAQTPKTPSGNQVVVETPMSKRTPDYFMRRTDIFNIMSSPSRGGPAPADSPLVKRKPVRAKSVSELVKEATELQNLQFEGQHELVLEAASAPPATDASLAPAAGTAPDAPKAAEEWTGRVRKGPKRQTKKMTMRPVDNNALPSTAKPTENYKRLKINNNRGKRPFRRR